MLASLSPEAPTGDPYAYVTLTEPVDGAPGGVRDLRLRVRGALRVARLGFTA